MIQAILDKTVDAVATATTNVTSIGTKGDGKEADFSMDNISSTIQLILDQSFTPDLLLTSPSKLWKAIVGDYAKYVFYGALADFIISGKAPMILGLKSLVDPYFEVAINSKAWDGTDGEKYAVLATSPFSWGHAELQAEPEVEIYRLPTALGNYVVTERQAGACETCAPRNIWTSG